MDISDNPNISRHVPAVDGRVLTAEYLDQKKIKMMPGFSEPYHDRPLKLGEIGCFMSHYNLWRETVDRYLGVYSSVFLGVKWTRKF